MRLAKELTQSSPILRNQTFSPNCAIGFLHLRPVLLISLVFPSLSILNLFVTCAGKRGSQLRNGLSSAMCALVYCSAEIRWVLHCLFTSHSHFHTTVGHVITLKWSLRNPTHAWTPHLDVLSYSVHYRISKWFCENQDLWWNQQVMKWNMLWDFSVHIMSLLFDHTCCLDKSELETCLRFLVSQNCNRKLRLESSCLFPLRSSVQFDVVHQHLNAAHQLLQTTCPESSCSCFSLLVGYSDSGNFCF